MIFCAGFQVIFLLRSNQSNRLTTTAISPSYSRTTSASTTTCYVPHGIRCPVRPSTSKTAAFQPLWSYNSRFASTDDGRLMEDEPDIERFLCRDAFPLGSLSLHDGEIIVNEITYQTENKKTPESVVLAFRLLSLLLDEVIFVQNKKGEDSSQRPGLISWQRLFSPSNLVYKVVNAWRESGSDSIVNLSPRNVFAMVKKWESGLPEFRSTTYINSMIVHATVLSKEPDLAEEILDYFLESTGKGQTSVNVVTFNTAIDAWAKSGRADAPQRAEALLKKMIDYSDAGLVEVTPDVVSFNSAITAWANSNSANSNSDKAPFRAENLFREMIARGLRPGDLSYSNMLKTWARSKEAFAAGRAHAILKQMVRSFKDGSNDVKPIAHCYTAVILAYANRGDIHQAEQLLFEHVELYQSTKDRDFLPHALCFTSIINAWAKSGKPDAPQMAEARLQQMQTMAELWGEPSLRPTVVSFTSVLDAWARSKDRDAPMRCEQILQRMQELYEKGHTGVQPNVVSFSAVLNSWSKSSRDDAPERAEAILREMERLHKAGNEGAKPNCYSFTTVMNVWARSGRWDAAERTQALFEDLVQKYADGDMEMKPTLHTYATLISAWGRSKNKDGAARAQQAFDAMVDSYRSGNIESKPDVVHFSALIDAWAKAGDPEKAENILRQMESNASLGVKATVVSYSTVMSAWSRSRFPDAANKAQSLFDELQQKYEAGDGTLQPNLHVYVALITAWGRSKHNDRAAKAQAAFDHMLAQYESGAKELKPNIMVCTALVDAWAKAGDSERAEQVLRGMESNELIGVKPTALTYSVVMSGWSRSRTPNSIDRMFALYDDMKKKYVAGDRGLKLDSFQCDILLSSWRGSKNHQDQLLKAQEVYKDVLTRFRSGETELKPLVVKYSFLRISMVKEVQK